MRVTIKIAPVDLSGGVCPLFNNVNICIHQPEYMVIIRLEKNIMTFILIILVSLKTYIYIYFYYYFYFLHRKIPRPV